MQQKTPSGAKINPWGDEHPEKARDSAQGASFGSQFRTQVSELASPDNWFSQILGQSRSKESTRKPASSEKPAVRRQETLVFSRAERFEEANLRKETHIIMQKLKEQVAILEQSEKNLVNEVSKIKVEQLPQKSGIYYIRYLEWMLTIVGQLRIKVEEGRAWLTTFNQRKKKRIGYWQMYKKHGTTFGLSHERTLATQTG